MFSGVNENQFKAVVSPLTNVLLPMYSFLQRLQDYKVLSFSKYILQIFVIQRQLLTVLKSPLLIETLIISNYSVFPLCQGNYRCFIWQKPAALTCSCFSELNYVIVLERVVFIITCQGKDIKYIAHISMKILEVPCSSNGQNAINILSNEV